MPLAGGNAATRRTLRRQCPSTPGVYGMIDAADELIYVGQSKSLQDRLLSYFTGTPASAKVRRIAEEARSLVWESVGHELTAWLRELELIRRWQPRLNVRGNPDRIRRGYVCIGGGSAPRAYVSVKPAATGGRTFGPVPANRQFRRSVRRLNDCFALRDCRRNTDVPFSDQLDLFPQDRQAQCIRGVVGTCLAPCASACSRQEYGDRTEAAADFLAGRDDAVLRRLQKAMTHVSDGRRFELAARLRDAHEDLSRLSAYLQRLREAYGRSFVYPARVGRGKENWYLIREGRIMAVRRGPNGRQASTRCLAALDAAFPRDDRSPGLIAPEDLDASLLVARWFRERPEELDRVLPPETARERCARR